MIKVAVLGTGPVIQATLPSYIYQKDAEFVAFADVTKSRAEDTAKLYKELTGKIAKVYSSYEELISNCIFDALIIAIDPDIQVDYAIDAMSRGIHVMTQVPVATTIEHCYKLVDSVRKTNVKYRVGEQTRYWDFLQKWKKMNIAGEFGKIYYAEGEYLHYEKNWELYRDIKNHKYVSNEHKNDSNIVNSWRHRVFKNPILYTPHQLSPILNILGGRITKVSCLGLPKQCIIDPNLDVCDLQVALMQHSSDAIISLKAGFTVPHGSKNILGAHWYQLKGSKASVESARSTLDLMKMYTPENGWENKDWQTVDLNAEDYIRNSTHGGADFYPFDDFIVSIISDRTPELDVYKAVEIAAPAILAAESANNGGILLDVPDFRI